LLSQILWEKRKAFSIRPYKKHYSTFELWREGECQVIDKDMAEHLYSRNGRLNKKEGRARAAFFFLCWFVIQAVTGFALAFSTGLAFQGVPSSGSRK
jgi:hypothetical protein